MPAYIVMKNVGLIEIDDGDGNGYGYDWPGQTFTHWLTQSLRQSVS